MLDRLNAGDIPAYELYWATDYPDPAGILGSLFGTDEPDNYVGYTNPEVDQLLDNAAAEPDADARAEIYDRINSIICSDNVVIPTYFDVEYTVVQPFVRNLVVTPMGIIRLETVQIAD
jgi:peptide/nickel transport system substrate-binding protein